MITAAYRREAVDPPGGAAEDLLALGGAEAGGQRLRGVDDLRVGGREQADRPVGAEHQPLRPEGVEHDLRVRAQVVDGPARPSRPR